MKTLLASLCLLGMTGCASIEKQSETKKNNEKFALSFIEEFFRDGMSFDEVKKRLGEPHEIFDFKNTPNEMAYYYYDKKNNLNEWSFGVNNKFAQVTWMFHYPRGNPLLDRIEILPQTLKKYGCQKKSKTEHLPGLTRELKFLECADGRIRARYNKYGEIEYIVVSGKSPKKD